MILHHDRGDIVADGAFAATHRIADQIARGPDVVSTASFLLRKVHDLGITDKSGVDAVAIWVNDFFGLSGDQRLGKTKVHRVARWVMDQYEVEERLTAISDEEMEAKVKELMPKQWAKYKGS